MAARALAVRFPKFWAPMVWVLALVVLPLPILGCAVRSGGLVASTGEATVETDWPRRYGEQAGIYLGEGSANVTLVEHRSFPTARVYELVPEGGGGFRAVLEAPGNRSTWTLHLEQDDRGWREHEDRVHRWLVVASTDIEVMSKGEQAKAGVAELFQALFAACRNRVVVVTGPPSGRSRGLCVVSSGIDGFTGIEQHLVELAQRGWTVVLTMTDLYRQGRSQQRARMGGFAGAFRDPAQRVDSELAEDAFVIEAVLRMLVLEEPVLADRPLVLVGSSLGAIGLPASAARLEGLRREEGPLVPAVSAAVLIGGGAGIGDLLLGSGLGRRQLRRAGIDPDEDRSPSLRATLDSECRLSPERCAWALGGRPVLLVDGMFDVIVPRSTADRLWEELGRPERWSYPVGHIGLFLLVGEGEWRRVADWVDRQAGVSP